MSAYFTDEVSVKEWVYWVNLMALNEYSNPDEETVGKVVGEYIAAVGREIESRKTNTPVVETYTEEILRPLMHLVMADPATTSEIIAVVVKPFLDSSKDDYQLGWWRAGFTVACDGLMHPNCPQEILYDAVKTRNQHYVKSVIYSPTCPEELSVYAALTIDEKDW